MGKKNIAKNFLLNLIYQILVIIVPVVTMPYVSRVLHPSGVGVYSYTYSVVSYFVLLASFGTTVYAQREVAYVQDNKEKVSKIFWEVLLFRVVFSIACFAIYVVVIDKNKLYNIQMIQGLYLFGVATDISWLFQGLEDFKKIVTRNILVKLANIGLIFLLVKKESDLIIYILVLAVLPVIGNLLLWPYLRKTIIWIPMKQIKIFRNFREIFQLFIPTVAVQIYTVLDKTMIGLITKSTMENGYYEQAEKAVKIFLAVFTALELVMSSRIANVFAGGQFCKIKLYMHKTYRVVWMLTLPMFSLVALLAPYAVPWFFGMEYAPIIKLMQIFSVLIVAIGFSSVTGNQYLVPIKKQTVLTITVIIGALLNVLLNLIFIPMTGAAGAALASIIAESIIAIIQMVYVLRINKGLSIHDIFGGASKYFIATIIMVLGIISIKGFFSPEIMDTLILGIIAVLLYGIALLVMGDSLLLEIMMRGKLALHQFGGLHSKKR